MRIALFAVVGVILVGCSPKRAPNMTGGELAGVYRYKDKNKLVWLQIRTDSTYRQTITNDLDKSVVCKGEWERWNFLPETERYDNVMLQRIEFQNWRDMSGRKTAGIQTYAGKLRGNEIRIVVNNLDHDYFGKICASPEDLPRLMAPTAPTSTPHLPGAKDTP